MSKPFDRSPERKLQVVLSVWRGELPATEAARRAGVAEQTVHNWKRAFVEAGRDGLGRRAAFVARGREREAQGGAGRGPCAVAGPEVGGEVSPFFEDLEMIRTESGCSVSRFAELAGVPRRTYHARLARLRCGEVPKEPRPAPVVDRIEPDVAKYAAEWPAWGYRKIAAIAAADGHDVGSPTSVKRAMARRGLLQPVRYQNRAPPTSRRPARGVRGPARAPQPRVAGGLHPVRDHRRGNLAALRRR